MLGNPNKVGEPMEHGERGDPVGAQRSDDQPGGTEIITGDVVKTQNSIKPSCLVS